MLKSYRQIVRNQNFVRVIRAEPSAHGDGGTQV